MGHSQECTNLVRCRFSTCQSLGHTESSEHRVKMPTKYCDRGTMYKSFKKSANLGCFGVFFGGLFFAFF